MSAAGMRRGFFGARPPAKTKSNPVAPVSTTASDEKESSRSAGNDAGPSPAPPPAGATDEADFATLLKVLKQAHNASGINQLVAAALLAAKRLPRDKPELLEKVFTMMKGAELLDSLLGPLQNPAKYVEGPSPDTIGLLQDSVRAGLEFMRAMLASLKIARRPDLQRHIPLLIQVFASHGMAGIFFPTERVQAVVAASWPPTAIHKFKVQDDAIVLVAAECLTRLLSINPVVMSRRDICTMCLTACSRAIVHRQGDEANMGPLLQLLRLVLHTAGRSEKPLVVFEDLDPGNAMALRLVACQLAGMMGDPGVLDEDPKMLQPGLASKRGRAKEALICLQQLLELGRLPLLKSLARLNEEHEEQEHGTVKRLLMWPGNAVNGICWAMLENPKRDGGEMLHLGIAGAALLLPAIGDLLHKHPVPLVRASGERYTTLALEVMARVVVTEYEVTLQDALNPDASTSMRPRSEEPGEPEASTSAPATPAAPPPKAPTAGQRAAARMGPLTVVCTALADIFNQAHGALPPKTVDLLLNRFASLMDGIVSAVNTRLAACAPEGRRELEARLVEAPGQLGKSWERDALHVVHSMGDFVGLCPSDAALELVQRLATWAEGALLCNLLPGIQDYLMGGQPKEEQRKWLDALADPHVLRGLAECTAEACGMLIAHMTQRAGPAAPPPAACPTKEQQQATGPTDALPDLDVLMWESSLHTCVTILALVQERAHALSLLGLDEAGKLEGTRLDALLGVNAVLSRWAHTRQRTTGQAPGEDALVSEVLRGEVAGDIMVLAAAALVGQLLLVACEVLEGAGVRLQGAMPMVQREGACELLLRGVQVGLVQVAEWARRVRSRREHGVEDAAAEAAESLEQAQMALDQVLAAATRLVQQEPLLLQQAQGAVWLRKAAAQLAGLQAHQQSHPRTLERVSDCIWQEGVELTALRLFAEAVLDATEKQGLDTLD